MSRLTVIMLYACRPLIYSLTYLGYKYDRMSVAVLVTRHMQFVTLISGFELLLPQLSFSTLNVRNGCKLKECIVGYSSKVCETGNVSFIRINCGSLNAAENSLTITPKMLCDLLISELILTYNTFRGWLLSSADCRFSVW